MITTAMIAGGVVGGQCTINYDTRYSAHSGLRGSDITVNTDEALNIL